MATNRSVQAREANKYGDLKRRLVFLLLALVVFRIGTHIPVPGINPDAMAELFGNQEGGVLGLFNLFSGGALSRFSVFALGIMPYISASIIMQLLTVVVPSLDQIKKEGEAGRRIITKYTRWATLALATFQALGISVALESQGNLVSDPGFMFRVVAVISLVTGTMFLMWLGEQITERGLGNGISLIIFSGIVSGLPGAIGGMGSLVSNGNMNPVAALIIMALVILVTAFVVFSMMGIYPVTPGIPVYNIGTPFFPKVTLRLASGRTFVIEAEGASSENKYIQKATLNGKPLDRPWIRHSDLAAGGKLVFTMGSRPNKSWGATTPPPSAERVELTE